MRTISPASARGSAENILPGKKAKTFSLKRGALTAFLLAFAVIFALFPERYVPVCLDGITIWALNVLPAVFPFLFVTALLRQTGGAEKVSRAFTPLSKALFGTGGEGGFCFFMSVLSGYPVGASLVAGMRKDDLLSRSDAEILACACSTSGPLFIIGSVGAGMFGDKRTGFIILAAHVLAVLLSAGAVRFFLSLRKRKDPAASRQTGRTASAAPPASDFSLSECVQSSVISALAVGGCIAVFYVLASMCVDFKLLYPLQKLLKQIPALAVCAEGVTKGLVEMTGGCLALAGLSTNLAAPCCAFLITLGGASILFQQIAYLRSAGIKLPFFLFVKLVQALGAFFLCLLFVSL